MDWRKAMSDKQPDYTPWYRRLWYWIIKKPYLKKIRHGLWEWQHDSKNNDISPETVREFKEFIDGALVERVAEQILPLLSLGSEYHIGEKKHQAEEIAKKIIYIIKGCR